MPKLTCYKTVNDDWYPNINGDQVRVTLYVDQPQGTTLVCVWGDDDCGMEFIGDEAGYIFHRLLEEPVLNRGVCERLGLTPA